MNFTEKIVILKETLSAAALLPFHMNCGFRLRKVFVINLIIFCTLVLLYFTLPGNCAVLVYLCAVVFECSFGNWSCTAMTAYQ